MKSMKSAVTAMTWRKPQKTDKSTGAYLPDDEGMRTVPADWRDR